MIEQKIRARCPELAKSKIQVPNQIKRRNDPLRLRSLSKLRKELHIHQQYVQFNFDRDVWYSHVIILAETCIFKMK